VKPLTAVAFHHTYWWVLALNAITLVPAFLLTRSERKQRAERASAEAVTAVTSVA
jgi:hypothetical protein